MVGCVLVHLMDASTVEMPPPPPLPQNIPVPLPPPIKPPKSTTRNQLPHRRSTEKIPTTRSHSTGDKSSFHGRNCFEGD